MIFTRKKGSGVLEETSKSQMKNENEKMNQKEWIGFIDSYQKFKIVIFNEKF